MLPSFRESIMIVFRLTLLCLSLSFLALSASAKTHEYKGFSFEIDPDPGWVKPLQADYDQVAGHDSDYLLVDDQSQWRPDGQSHYFKIAIRANNLDSLEKNSRVEAVFIPEYQRLRWHSLDIIRDGKRISKLDPRDVRIIQTEDELDKEMLTGQVTSLVFIPDTRVGDVIEYSYTVEGTNPIFDNRFFRRYNLSWQDPVAQRQVRVVTPPGKYMRTQLSDPAYTLAHHVNSEGEEYVLSVRNTPAIKYEEGYPADFQPQQQVEFSDFGSWQAVSDWASKLYPHTSLKHPELTSLVARLQLLPKEQAIGEALYFVQNRVRYVGVELGINSHLPRSPEKVMQDGYGDCKDKTLLLVSILGELGIKAYPALVSTYSAGAFVDMLPAPSHFDHVITLVELPEKSFWVDPTRRFQRGDVSTIGYSDYGYALPVGYPQSGPKAMTFAADQIPSYEAIEEYRILAYGAPVVLTVTNLFKAGKADYVRWQIATSGVKGVQEKYLSVIQSQHPEAKVLFPLQVVEDEARDQLKVTEGYLIPDFTQISQDAKTWEYSTSLFALSGYVEVPRLVVRQWPWGLPESTYLKHKVVIHHPEILNLTANSEDIHLNHKAFRFSAKERGIQNQIINEVELAYTGLKSLNPEEVPEFMKLIEQIKNRAFISYSVRNTQADGVSEAMSAVMPVIEPYLGSPYQPNGRRP